jgi:pimeloyl-ACP methyl ester carboxylesterase
MPEVSNQGVKIRYEMTGQGRPLVLLHGWLCDRSWWAETGYIDDLRQDHRLVLVDMRGHGESDKPHDGAAYHAASFAGDVLAVADAEGLDRFAIWGLSYGGWVGWQTADAAPLRVSALITTGSWDPSPGTQEDWLKYTEPDLEVIRSRGIAAVIEQFEDERFQFPDAVRRVLLRSDPEAMIACQSSELVSDGVADLEGFPVPALVIVGELEDPDGGAARTAAKIAHGESLTLAGMGHAAATAASGLTIPTARAFLERWSA